MVSPILVNIFSSKTRSPVFIASENNVNTSSPRSSAGLFLYCSSRCLNSLSLIWSESILFKYSFNESPSFFPVPFSATVFLRTACKNSCAATLTACSLLATFSLIIISSVTFPLASTPVIIKPCPPALFLTFFVLILLSSICLTIAASSLNVLIVIPDMLAWSAIALTPAAPLFTLSLTIPCNCRSICFICSCSGPVREGSCPSIFLFSLDFCFIKLIACVSWSKLNPRFLTWL